MIKSKEIAKALFSISQKEGDHKDLAKSFLNFAKEKNLTHLIPEVLHHLKIFSEKQKESETLNIKLSHEVGENSLLEIEKVMEASGAKRNIIIDKEIVGGFIAEYKGKILDATIKNQLTRLRAKIAGINS